MVVAARAPAAPAAGGAGPNPGGRTVVVGVHVQRDRRRAFESVELHGRERRCVRVCMYIHLFTFFPPRVRVCMCEKEKYNQTLAALWKSVNARGFRRSHLTDRRRMAQSSKPNAIPSRHHANEGFSDYCPFAMDFAEVAKRAVHSKIRCQDR